MKPATRRCRLCGNTHGLIRSYRLNLCRQCFKANARKLGFKKYD